jgi:hypothetical protein
MSTDVVTFTLPAHPAAVLLADTIDHLVPPAGEDNDCCPACCALCKVIETLLKGGTLDDLVRTVANSRVWWQGNRIDGHVDRDWLARGWGCCSCANGAAEEQR